MKRLLIIFVFSLFASSVWAQTIMVHRDYCKKSEIEIIEGNIIPDGYAIIGTGSFIKSEIGMTLKELTEKQIRHIRSYGKMFKSCKMFVDFKAVLTFFDKDGKALSDREVSFYALAPISDCQ
jgi:hypothetical protein